MSEATTKAGLPEKMSTWEDLESILAPRRLDVRHGRFSYSAFKAPEEARAVTRDAYTMFFDDNAIYGGRIAQHGEIEQELHAMCLSLFHPTPTSAVTTTSGGTESIFVAMYAAREWARLHRPNARVPEVILPYSAHAAFTKSCHYLGMKASRVPLDDWRADPARMEDAITANTIALVGSFPCWPYGRFDPIEALGEIAGRHNLWLHVDACVGGYFAPFCHAAGYQTPPFDFSVPGVTSISADLHKYGYCPPPCSTVLWRSAEVEPYRYSGVSAGEWPSGAYRTSGFTGSRPASSVFAAWALLKHLGQEGYVALTRRTLAAKTRIVEGLQQLSGIQPHATDAGLVVFSSNGVPLESVSAGLFERNWFVFGVRDPKLIQLIVGPCSDEAIEPFLSDLGEIVQKPSGGATKAGRLDYT